MSKLENAKEVLRSLNTPLRQQNNMCCYVLLAMADLAEEGLWKNATNKWIRIHDIIRIANMPDHMIHLNGDRFLGPR